MELYSKKSKNEIVLINQDEELLKWSRNENHHHLSYFDPALFGKDIWIELILANNFTDRDLLQFGLTCRYFSQILASPKIQEIQTIKMISDPYLGHTEAVNDVCWSPDGLTLATCSDDRTVRLWNTHTGKEIVKFKGHQRNVHAIDFHPSGDLLASGSEDRVIFVWTIARIRSQSRPKTRIFASAAVFGLQYTPDGAFLVAAVAHNGIGFWDTKTDQLTRTLREHLHPVHSLRFHPTAGNLVSCDESATIIVWDSDNLKSVLKLTDRATPFVDDLAISPDGKTLASFAYERGVLLWSLETGQLSSIILENSCSSGCFADKGDLLCLSSDASIQINRWRELRTAEILSRHALLVNKIALSPDGRYLASASKDKRVYLYSLNQHIE